MRLHYISFLTSLFLFSQFASVGQVKSKTITDAIIAADTVLLVSHNLTEQRLVQDKVGPGLSIKKSPPIVFKGRPNKKIIHETVLINKTLKVRLISILSQPNTDRELKNIQCFLPHHSILLIKNGSTSSIQLSFMCENLLPSKGIEHSGNYPKVMWKQLESFFTSLGIKYQIPFNGGEQ